ncbi:MAG: hypothetical protein IPF41_08345 [Flavobacteriales bacterium]|nr:hypothetical protein [Flavobacteriales bacterium]
MKWLKRITPFRIAVTMFIGYQLIVFLGERSNFTSSGGSAWGGVALIAILFWGIVFWLVDIVMRRFIHDVRLIWGIQLLAILAMYLFLDW